MTDFRLKVFESVARLGSFTKAARELGITQPAVSGHISELEKNIGDLLFERKAGRVAITLKGELMLGYARKILSLYEIMAADIVPGAVEECTIRVCACPLAYKFILPELIRKYQTLRPSVHFSLVERDAGREQECDIAIVTEADASGNPSLIPFADFSLKDNPLPFVRMYARLSPASPSVASAIDHFLLFCKSV